MVRKIYAKVLLDNCFYDVAKMFNNKTEPNKIIAFIDKKMKELKGKNYYKVVWYEEKAYDKINYVKESDRVDDVKLVVRNGMIIEE